MSASPMFQQYRVLKEQNSDSILMFRLGDFYEMFGDDAKVAAVELDIVLTQRNFGQGVKMPMCGVPHHAADGYVARLIQNGHKVAIVEQTEPPRKGKQLVNRDVVRVVTPGTYLDLDRLDAGRNNYILSIIDSRDVFGIGVLDVSTGEFRAGEIARDPAANAVIREVERIAPRECVVFSSDTENGLARKLREKFPKIKTTELDTLFDAGFHRDRLCSHFGTTSLRGFGIEDHPVAIMAAGQILEYVRDNLKTDPKHIQSVSLYMQNDGMYLDPTTKRNLELTETIREKDKKGSLLWVIDRTVTPMGKRLIRKWLEQPLTDPAEINLRLDGVDELLSDRAKTEIIVERLSEIRDLERLSSRVATMLITPKELLAIRDSISVLPEVFEEINMLKSDMFRRLVSEFDVLEDVKKLLDDSINEDAPRAAHEGGIIRSGYDGRVDELRDAKSSGRNWIVNLEEQERKATGIKSLKIGFNKVFGYFIEVTNSNLKNVPEHYTRKQTMSNGERFITEELKEKEIAILGAESKLNDLEYELFCEVRDSVSDRIGRILKTSRVIAIIDVIASLARVADENGYCRPQVSNSEAVKIEDGCHPVLGMTLPAHTFIPNDTGLNCSRSQVHIITGPNMSGKSTYMRQVGLIVLMAQMGSFVPCRSAEIGVVDRIFTRVGAVDDITLGLSTFMVEMVETSLILNNATRKSLILLDEVGRGTSTTDGVSIAWAVTEYIHERIGAKTLFATHFNELTQMADRFERIENLHVSAHEKGSDIVFTHKLRPGSTDRSFGVEVARLAGIPSSVIRRAAEVLSSQESSREIPVPESRTAQLALIPDHAPSRIEELLKGVDADELSPKKALDLVFRLKEIMEENDNAG
ncbi:MAG TPA: DNA mismatch repair protein MutS [bacterium]|nr:DNA mismatch repair protein MutS [bacterium]